MRVILGINWLGETVKYFLYIFPKDVQNYRVPKYRASASREKSSYFELGASLVEYGLLVSLIAVVAIAAVQILGQESSEKLRITACQFSEDPFACCSLGGVKNPEANCPTVTTESGK